MKGYLAYIRDYPYKDHTDKGFRLLYVIPEEQAAALRTSEAELRAWHHRISPMNSERMTPATDFQLRSSLAAKCQ